jgi:thiamine kinase-like enzyme
MTTPKTSQMWEPMGRLEAKINYVENNPKIPYTVHGDWHGYNMIYTDASQTDLIAIDLDQTWIGSPLVDLARLMWLDDWNFEARQTLVAAWLAKRGIADEDGSKAMGWLMDAEIYKLLANIYGVFIQDLQKCTLAPQPLSRGSYRTPQPKEHEAFLWLIDLWNHASSDN